MSASCTDCGAAFHSKPFAGCPFCGNADITIKADSVTERPTEAPDPDYINEMVRHLLNDLIEKTYSGPCTAEFWDSQIERTIERMRPYLISSNCDKISLE